MLGRTAICLLALAAPALLGQEEAIQDQEGAIGLSPNKGLAIVSYEKYYHSVKFAVNRFSVPRGCVVRVEVRPVINFESTGPQEFGMLMIRKSTVPKAPGDAGEEKEREKAREKEGQEKKKEEKELWQLYSMPAEMPHTWEFKFGPNSKVTNSTPGLVKFYFPVTEFRYSGSMWEREIVVRTGLTYPMNRFNGLGRVDYIGKVTVLVDNKVVGVEQFKTDVKGWFFPTMEYSGSIDINFKKGKPKVALSPPNNRHSTSSKQVAIDSWRHLEVDLLEMLKRGELADVY
jgi:hypothetical protein